MAFIKNSTCELITGTIPIIKEWVGKPCMVHTSAISSSNENTQTDNNERYHVETLGWDHIGYIFSIEKDGRVYFSRPTAYKQYHCVGGGQNHKSFGVCIIGDGTKENMTQEQKFSLDRIIITYQVKEILFHRDFPYNGIFKKCPGDVLLEDINKRFGVLVKRI